MRTGAAVPPSGRHAAYVREVAERRAAAQAALRTGTSILAAVARHQLPVGTRLRFGPSPDSDVRLAGMPCSIEIHATSDGFRVDGQPSGPRTIAAGRYGLRLSHQHAPAVVVLDAQSSRLREEVELRWYAVDPALRLRTRLLPDGAAAVVASTGSAARPAERVGWLPLVVSGVAVRLAALRLLEPGVAPDHLDVYFRDATTGSGSYELGRYVTVEREGDALIVDFNLAYNPWCALSSFYNCPIPPRENHLTVAIRAGEMTPLVRSAAARG